MASVFPAARNRFSSCVGRCSSTVCPYRRGAPHPHHPYAHIPPPRSPIEETISAIASRVFWAVAGFGVASFVHAALFPVAHVRDPERGMPVQGCVTRTQRGWEWHKPEGSWRGWAASDTDDHDPPAPEEEPAPPAHPLAPALRNLATAAEMLRFKLDALRQAHVASHERWQARRERRRLECQERARAVREL